LELVCGGAGGRRRGTIVSPVETLVGVVVVCKSVAAVVVAGLFHVAADVEVLLSESGW